MKIIITFLITLLITSCSNINQENNNISTPYRTISAWDFDHNIQFKQTQLSKNRYYLEIIPNTKTHFNLVATVLLRHSLEICQHYGYTIEVLGGVESFDDVIGAPNFIVGSLKANIECAEK